MAASLVLLGLVAVSQATLHYPGEGHLSNVRQLTFGGQNAEGYFSFDDKFLTLQATGKDHYGTGCDQIYRLDLTQPAENQTLHRLSTGLGSCTCSYFYPDNSHVLYAGNFHKIRVNASAGFSDDSCPEKVCQSQRAKTDPKLANLCNTSYTWDINPDYDIFKVNQYGNVVAQLTDSPGYDAEGVMSPDGKYIAFTSIRSGDLELWIMNADGTNPRQITNTLGYDGGSFFSPDGKRLIFRASRPKTLEEIQKYKDLLSYNLVAPTAMELFVVDVDGKNMRQITHLGGANWAPYYHKNNRQVIFSSDFNSTVGFGAFDLYLINDDGTGLERVTWDNDQFDSFPMFSYSGKQLVWGSSRNGNGPYDLNLFIADWTDTPANTTNKAEEKETRAEIRSNRVSDAIRRVEQEKEEEQRDGEQDVAWMDKQTEPFDGILHYPNEVHLSNVKQLTFGGANAEGYFSFDNKRLTIQATGKDNYGTGCDQIYCHDSHASTLLRPRSHHVLLLLQGERRRPHPIRRRLPQDLSQPERLVEHLPWQDLPVGAR